MFNPYRTVIDAFVTHCVNRYHDAFPNRTLGHEEFLEQSARTALETLLNCDCPYHDANHTILVTDVGQTILRGRLISQGDVSPHEWVHAVVAMLFHDIGYRRGLLKGDRDGSYITDEEGNRVKPPQGATDAYLMPYHVTRGCLFMHERFGSDPSVDVATITSYIEMTRFPVPQGQTLSAYRHVCRVGSRSRPHRPDGRSTLCTEARSTVCGILRNRRSRAAELSQRRRVAGRVPGIFPRARPPIHY
jgi:hypothetical protein